MGRAFGSIHADDELFMKHKSMTAREYDKRNPLYPRYRKAKYSAKKRGIPFSITRQEYESIASKECAYCNGYFGRVRWCGGLDRLNNALGYVMDNLVSCCVVCNRIKAEWFTFDEASFMIRALIGYRKNKLVLAA